MARSGRSHVVVGNFAKEMIGLYHNEGNGVFIDEAPRTAVEILRPSGLRERAANLTVNRQMTATEGKGLAP